MPAERPKTHETLPPEELGRRTYLAMREITYNLANNPDFAAATAEQFFHGRHTDRDSQVQIGGIDRKIRFSIPGGHTFDVHFRRNQAATNTDRRTNPDGYISPLWNEFTHIELTIDRFCVKNGKDVPEGSLTLSSDLTEDNNGETPEEDGIQRTYLNGRIEVTGSEPDSDAAFAELPVFVADLCPHFYL